MMDGSRSRLADDEIIRNRAICNLQPKILGVRLRYWNFQGI